MIAMTWDEIRHEWFLDLPGAVSSEEAVRGFATARELLGGAWPEEYAAGDRGFWTAIFVVDIGLTLAPLKGLAKIEILLRLIKEDPNSGLAHARVLAALRREGVDVEIEPELEGRRPDIRARWMGDDIYIEVARPIPSQQERAIRHFQISVAEGVFGLVDDERHIEIAMQSSVAEHRAAVLKEIGAMLATGRTDGSVADIATILISPIDQFRLKDRVPPTPNEILAVTGRLDVPSPGHQRRRQVTVRIPWRDERAKRVLAEEREQLSRDTLNVVALDITHIANESGWRALVSHELRPDQNTRVGAVVLFSTVAEDRGVTAYVRTIRNEFARRSLPESFLEALERGLRAPR
jgi:hypothetical protein